MTAAITITELAQRKLVALCDLHAQTTIKLAVRSRGCSGNSYHMDFIDGGAVRAADEVVALADGNRLVIEAKAIMLVLGTRIDWVERGLESKFEFQNPRAVGTCGCGDSFLTD